jgi:hypothetical protein
MSVNMQVSPHIIRDQEKHVHPFPFGRNGLWQQSLLRSGQMD